MRVVLALTTAVLFAAPIHAQDTTVRSQTTIKTDDAQVMTLSGCLSGGPSAFVLSNVVAAGKGPDGGKSAGDASVARSYDLVPRSGLALTPYVGHRVQITGAVVEARSGGDDDAEVEIREKTEVEREGAPDTKVETTTRARIARGPSPRLAVTAVKSVSPLCLQ